MKKLLICLCIFILAFTGCSSQNKSSDASVVFYLINDGKELASSIYNIDETDAKKWADKIVSVLNNGEGIPANGESLLSEGVKIKSISFFGTIVTADLSPAYENKDIAGKLLIRAGITKTLTQHKDITAVTVTVDGKPIYDSSGNEIGPMTSSMYVDENANDINNYRSSRMTLYFTNEQGNVLIPQEREVYYSINTPLEQAVVNELVQGPSNMGLIRTLPVETNVLNVTIQDGICYVNFDESFLNNTLNTSPEVQIYSIVNSLYKVCQVEKVAFSVNGSNQYTLKDSISLANVFSPDMELVKSDR